MKTIWKFSIDASVEIKAPGLGSTVLVGVQGADHFVVWAEVDTEQADAVRTYYVVGTGHPIPRTATRHVGSYVDGSFVWHVYTDEPDDLI